MYENKKKVDGLYIVPFVSSLLSFRPPHNDIATVGRSRRPSEMLSTPLSTPELPTDCGDWLVERTPFSDAIFPGTAGSPLRGNKENEPIQQIK